MNRLIAAASAAVMSLSLAAGAVSAQDFRALAQQDLQAARDALAANHPAAVIPGAPGEAFRNWIDAGYQDAMGRVGRVNSGDSHAYLLRYYANGFRDSNTAIRPTYEGQGPFFAIGWPGVTTSSTSISTAHKSSAETLQTEKRPPPFQEAAFSVSCVTGTYSAAISVFFCFGMPPSGQFCMSSSSCPLAASTDASFT